MFPMHYLLQELLPKVQLYYIKRGQGRSMHALHMLFSGIWILSSSLIYVMRASIRLSNIFNRLTHQLVKFFVKKN
jgi:hypothetical protein